VSPFKEKLKQNRNNQIRHLKDLAQLEAID